ncbi:MAG: hypothetical protein V3S69_00220 [Dehalococcoidales bacterium]
MIGFSMKKDRKDDTPKLVVDVKPDLLIEIDEDAVIIAALDKARGDAIRKQVSVMVGNILKRSYFTTRSCMDNAYKARGYCEAQDDLVEYIVKELI